MNDAISMATEAFAAYAALDKPHVPGNQWSALQVRLARWEVTQFGYQPMERAVLGVSEEVGELAQALRDQNDVMVFDAVADIAVYSIQIATHLRADFFQLLTRTPPVVHLARTPYLVNITIEAGALCHATLKALQKIRGMEDRQKFRSAALTALGRLAAESIGLVGDFGRSYSVLVTQVAESVMLRNWVDNKVDGGTNGNGGAK